MPRKRKVTVPFFISHQGCPHDCLFCDQRRISGAEGALPTAEDIVAKVVAWRATAGSAALEVAFFGGTFTALHPATQEALLAPLTPFIRSGAVATVRISTRPDCIDPDTVKRIAAMGVGIIELGVQSMDDRVLDAAGRGHTAADSAAAIGCIKEQGLSAGAQLMPGLPGDTPALALESLDRVVAAGADFIRLYPAVVLRDTGLALLYARGAYEPLSIEKGVSLCKVLLHRAVNAGVEVIRIGLQASDDLNPDNVMAGCFHPAFGNMVKSELFYDLLRKLITGLPEDAVAGPVTLCCHSSAISEVYGYEGRNLKRLHAVAPGAITVKPEQSCSRYDLEVRAGSRILRDHIYNPQLYQGAVHA